MISGVKDMTTEEIILKTRMPEKECPAPLERLALLYAFEFLLDFQDVYPMLWCPKKGLGL